MSDRKKIVSGISIDFIGSIIATTVGFVVVPYYFEYISVAEFGLWLAIGGLTALITMVDLGTDSYLTTVTSNNILFYSDNYGNYISSVLIIKNIVALLLAIVSLLIYLWLPHFIDIEENYLNVAKTTYIFGVVILLLATYFSTITTVLYARHHYSLINSFASIFAILTSVGTLLLLRLDYGIVSFPMAMLITNVIQHVILFIFLIKNYPNVKLKIKNFHFIDKKEIIGYTTTFQILRWVQTVRTQYITIAINNLIGPTYVAQYNLTNKIPQIVPGYAVKIVHPFFPIIADLFHKGEIEKIQEIFLKISKLLFRIALFFGIATYIMNEPFITFWVGSDKFAGSGVVLLLIIYMVVYIAMGAFGIVIYASKKFESWTKWSVVEILFAITLSYLFSFRYGLGGIVAGFVMSSMITQVYLFTIVLKQLNLKSLFFLAIVLKYSISSNLLPLVFGLIILNFVNISNWLTFIFVGLGFVLFGFLVDFIKIYKSKEKGFKNKVFKVLIS